MCSRHCICFSWKGVTCLFSICIFWLYVPLLNDWYVALHSKAISLKNKKSHKATHAPPRSIKFGSPFIVLTEAGCSGTTALGQYIRRISLMHGYSKDERVGFEFLNTHQYNSRNHKYKNQYYQDIVKERNLTKEEETKMHSDLVIESIKRGQEEAIKSGNLMYFKATVKQCVELRSRLEDLESGVSYVGFYRENMLDRCTCMVKDCLYEGKGFGTPVFGSNGTKTDLCFNRRYHPEMDVQANFTNVKGCLEKDEQRVKFIRDQGIESFSSDSLYLFENSVDSNDFQTSINTWMRFLKPLLQDELQRDLVASALKEGRGGRMDQVSSQKDNVYNYEEVKEELTGTVWEKLLHY